MFRVCLISILISASFVITLSAEVKADKIADDFSLSWHSYTAGVIGIKEPFIKIKPTAKGKFELIRGYNQWKDGQEITASNKKEISAEDCLKFYKQVTASGFLKLDNAYSSEVVGGTGAKIVITHNASTKEYSPSLSGFFCLNTILHSYLYYKIVIILNKKTKRYFMT